MWAESVRLESFLGCTAVDNETQGSTVTAMAFFKRPCNGVTIFPGCTPVAGLRRVPVTGTGATSNEPAQEASEDRLVAALGNRAPPSVRRLQECCGK